MVSKSRRFATTAAALLLCSVPIDAASEFSVAKSILEFGGSVASLMWVHVDGSAPSNPPPDRYTALATEIKRQIAEGRATSAMVSAHFDMVATTMAYAAIIDKEPLSLALVSLGAYGAKKAGDAISDKIMSDAQARARGILARAIKESGISPSELRTMSAAELGRRVGEFQLGGAKLRDLLSDVPGAIELLEAASKDLALDIGVEGIARSEAIANDVTEIKATLQKTIRDIDTFQTTVKTRLDRVDRSLRELREAAVSADAKLDALKKEVQGNTAVIQSLAAISYAGWSTAQKLQAVQSGMFPELSGSQKEAAIAALKAQQDLEQTVASLQSVAQDFGNLAQIAGNIGLPKDLVTGLQGAQVVAGSLAKFASGDYLGAIAGATSLVGLGAPDAGAQRHAEMMGYLRGAFEEVNKNLTRIIDLQVQTLTAIGALARGQEAFRKEVLQQLDRIEAAVLQNRDMLQNIILERWKSCHAFVYGTALNGQFDIPDRDVLLDVLKDTTLSSSAGGCFRTTIEFLKARVKPASWKGDIIDAQVFPTTEVGSDEALQAVLRASQTRSKTAFETSRAFLLRAAPEYLDKEALLKPASLLARLSQPVVDAEYALALKNVLGRSDVAGRFSNFTCADQANILASPLTELICVGVLRRSDSAPKRDRLQAILNAPLIGPQAYWLTEMGITLAKIVDFGYDDNGTFKFVSPSVITDVFRGGPAEELMAGIRQGNGVALLTKLQWLVEAIIIQQAVMHGDLTAELIKTALYDPKLRSFNTSPDELARSPFKLAALAAMKANPILARNAVMLAFRQAVEDSLDGRDEARRLSYQQVYYHVALTDFQGPQACDPSPNARRKLEKLFPNWSFEYRVPKELKTRKGFEACLAEIVDDYRDQSASLGFGSGVAVNLGDFYVIVPSPSGLPRGVLEISDSLKLALLYRDRLSQAIIDRRVGKTVAEIVGPNEVLARELAFGILNEGWGWRGRGTVMKKH